MRRGNQSKKRRFHFQIEANKEFVYQKPIKCLKGEQLTANNKQQPTNINHQNWYTLSKRKDRRTWWLGELGENRSQQRERELASSNRERERAWSLNRDQEEASTTAALPLDGQGRWRRRRPRLSSPRKFSMARELGFWVKTRLGKFWDSEPKLF